MACSHGWLSGAVYRHDFTAWFMYYDGFDLHILFQMIHLLHHQPSCVMLSCVLFSFSTWLVYFYMSSYIIHSIMHSSFIQSYILFISHVTIYYPHVKKDVICVNFTCVHLFSFRTQLTEMHLLRTSHNIKT